MTTTDLEIVDTHFHLWDPHNTPHPLRSIAKLFGWHPGLYGWICDTVVPRELIESLGTTKLMREAYLPQDYQADIGGVNITRGVYMPYAWKTKSDLDFAEEAAFAERLFRNAPNTVNVDLGAIVGSAHFRNFDILQKLIERYHVVSDKVVGLREMLAWSSDASVMSYTDTPNLAADITWRKGFEVLAKNGLMFEAWGYHTQLNEIADLAMAFPETNIVLAHMGTPVGAFGPVGTSGYMPADRDRVIKQWQEGIARVAENQNVICKISGLFLTKLGWGLHKNGTKPSHGEIIDRLLPMVDFVIAQFGPERCMFGSHCPPDKVSLGLTEIYSIYEQMTAKRPMAERRMLFSETAQNVYRIKAPVLAS